MGKLILLIVIGVAIWYFVNRSKKRHKALVTSTPIAPNPPKKGKSNSAGLNFTFYSYKPEDLEIIKAGDLISLWQPSGEAFLIAFKSGGVGGQGKLGELKPSDSQKIIAMAQGKQAKVIDVTYDRVRAVYPA